MAASRWVLGLYLAAYQPQEPCFLWQSSTIYTKRVYSVSFRVVVNLIGDSTTRAHRGVFSSPRATTVRVSLLCSIGPTFSNDKSPLCARERHVVLSFVYNGRGHQRRERRERVEPLNSLSHKTKDRDVDSPRTPHREVCQGCDNPPPGSVVESCRRRCEIKTPPAVECLICSKHGALLLTPYVQRGKSSSD